MILGILLRLFVEAISSIPTTPIFVTGTGINQQNIMESTLDSTPCKCTACKQFFATAATDFLCSSCHKSTHKTEKPAPPAPIAAQQSKPTTSQADTSRCFKCKKNVGLLGVNCKCGFIFCNKHRMPEEHECQVDYRKIGKEELAKEYKVVAPRKLSEI